MFGKPGHWLLEALNTVTNMRTRPLNCLEANSEGIFVFDYTITYDIFKALLNSSWSYHA